jgi:hypothetical protein
MTYFRYKLEAHTQLADRRFETPVLNHPIHWKYASGKYRSKCSLAQLLWSSVATSWGQFHQHFLIYICRSQKRKTSLITWLSFFLLLGSSPIKALQKMLMKLTPWVNFTNVLRAAFTFADHKSTKRHWWLDCLFVILRRAHVKDARKHVGEIDPCLPIASTRISTIKMQCIKSMQKWYVATYF